MSDYEVDRRAEIVEMAMQKAKASAALISDPDVHNREFPFTNDDFLTLSNLIHEKTGIVLKDHKKNMVYSRLARRLRGLGIGSFSDYLVYLTGPKGEEEIGALINAITTNLTKFFREDHHFEHFENVVLKNALRNFSDKGANRLRFWSAGCSSGEEPYSMAILLNDALKRCSIQTVDAKILATDLDTSMLRNGRKGLYPERVVENIREKYSHYLQQDAIQNDMYQISPELRRYIAFKKLNLLAKWPVKGPFDAIFCRNVMIYFDNQTKAELTRRFASLLKPGGWLYIGHSETILGAENNLKLFGRTIYRRIS